MVDTALCANPRDIGCFFSGFGPSAMIDGRDAEGAGKLCVGNQQQREAIWAARYGKPQARLFRPPGFNAGKPVQVGRKAGLNLCI